MATMAQAIADAPRPRLVSALRPGTLDALTILGCWIVVSFLSTAQRWTWLNTPDAEFYATLGLFGSEVTDRTVTPVYYWTRLGTIAPVRLLSELLGPWTGYHVFWLLLVAVMITSVFLMLRRFTSRPIAALMAVLTSLSTVVLAFLGNPYVTGTAMAAMVVIIAGIVWGLPTTSRESEPAEGTAARLAAPIITGLAFGWLVMTNPNATFMTAAIWIVATVVVALHRGDGRGRYVVRTTILTGLGATASFLLLLLAGRVIFPGLDWLDTYLFWSRALDLSAYVSDAWAFTRDISIVVPLTIMATVVAVALLRPRDPLMRVAAVLSPTAFGFTVLFLVITPNGTLEVGHYQSLQWPPALCGLALAVAAVAGRRRIPVAALVAGAAVVLLVILAGHSTAALTLPAGWLIACITAAAFVGSAALVARTEPDTRRAAVTLVALVVTTGMLMSGFQLLQNSRRPTGVMAEGVYSNAFNPNDTEARLVSSYDAQRWLIGQTTRDDTVMVWVDADWARQEQTLLSMAAFQIWGANQITPERTLDETGLANATAARTSVIAMYGKSMEAIVTFWSSIPREVKHSDPVCSTYPWPDPAVPTAHLCLTRLTWP